MVEEVQLAPGALLLAVAPNAAGKTNFLESVVMLLRGRSWRATPAACVTWGQNGFQVTGEALLVGGERVRLAVQYKNSSQAPPGRASQLSLKENDAPASLITYYSRYPLLVFLPEDTFLLARGPAERRNFLNSVLVSSPLYVANLVRYRRSWQQRNEAIKKARTAADLDPWTNLLVQSGTVVWQQRQAFVDFLNNHLSLLYERLTGESLPLGVELVTVGTPNGLVEQLERTFNIEKRLGYTLTGPHRDDLAVRVKERWGREVLSRGQVRGVVLALKVAAYRFLKTLTNEEPLLLLDDVFSELDEVRQRVLLANLPASQLLITSTAVPETFRQRSNVLALDLQYVARTQSSPAPEKNRAAVARG